MVAKGNPRHELLQALPECNISLLDVFLKAHRTERANDPLFSRPDEHVITQPNPFCFPVGTHYDTFKRIRKQQQRTSEFLHGSVSPLLHRGNALLPWNP